MYKKLYIPFVVVVLTACSSVEEQADTNLVVLSSSPSPIYPDNSSFAVVLKKRLLSHNRELYEVRLADGREVFFTSDTPLSYQVGDKIVLPS